MKCSSVPAFDARWRSTKSRWRRPKRGRTHEYDIRREARQTTKGDKMPTMLYLSLTEYSYENTAMMRFNRFFGVHLSVSTFLSGIHSIGDQTIDLCDRSGPLKLGKGGKNGSPRPVYHLDGEIFGREQAPKGCTPNPDLRSGVLELIGVIRIRHENLLCFVYGCLGRLIANNAGVSKYSVANYHRIGQHNDVISLASPRKQSTDRSNIPCDKCPKLAMLYLKQSNQTLKLIDITKRVGLLRVPSTKSY